MADAQALEFSSVHALGSGGGYFSSVLKPATPTDADAWVWLAYDQLHPSMLSSLSLDGTVGVVLIESSAKARRRPYHQQKLGVLLSNQRHFAVELQDAGTPVVYVSTHKGYGEALASLTAEVGPIHCIRAAERELREEVASLVEDRRLVEHDHPGWLTPRSWFLSSVQSRAFTDA